MAWQRNRLPTKRSKAWMSELVEVSLNRVKIPASCPADAILYVREGEQGTNGPLL
jgi:hypothetical protein